MVAVLEMREDRKIDSISSTSPGLTSLPLLATAHLLPNSERRTLAQQRSNVNRYDEAIQPSDSQHTTTNMHAKYYLLQPLSTLSTLTTTTPVPASTDIETFSL